MTPFCTDEDIALRCSADFPLIVPRDQTLSRGTDGAIAAGGWILTSATQSFDPTALQPGQVVILTGGSSTGSGPGPTFRPPGDTLVIQSVSPTALTMRRKGLGPSIGYAPGNMGPVANVAWSVATFGPQIGLVSYDLDRRYGVNDFLVGRRTSDLWDPTELKDACVLEVLYRAYMDQSRGTESYIGSAQGKPDVWSAKARSLKQELDELLARVVLHWRPVSPGLGQPIEPTTSKFSARIVR